jgi:hypothetical protein
MGLGGESDARSPPFLSLRNGIMEKQFYEKILPSQGVYCVTGIKNGKAFNRFAETLDGVLHEIQTFKEDSFNVYIAANAFADYSRKADNAKWSRSFFVDLDVGQEENKYATQELAHAGLNEFVTKTELPPPYVINSGTGIQAWWAFADDIPANEWKAYAEKFKNFCLANGLLIDKTVTADAARIMRCPDTLNYKHTPPIATEVVACHGHQFDFDSFKEFLGEVKVDQTTSVVNDVLSKVEKGLDDDTAAFKNQASNFALIIQKTMEGHGCGQIRNIVVNAKTLGYDLWTAGLSIATKCEDRDIAIHAISEDHPNYDWEATEVKASAEWKGPRTCNWFRSNYPQYCKDCTLKISSPIEIGKIVQVSPYAEEAVETDPIRIEENPKAVPLFPKSLFPFSRGRKGGVYYTSTEEDDDGNAVESTNCILVHDLFPIKRVIGGPEGEMLIMRQIKPNDAPLEFPLPMKQIGSIADLTKMLGTIGEIIETPNHGRSVLMYLKKWAVYLQEKEAAEIMRMQMGWSETNDAFVVGNTEMLPDGRERPAATSAAIRGTARLFTREGSYAEWQSGIKVFNEPGFEIHAFAGPLAGFGAPLMRYTASPGGTIGLVSSQTGHGKSATLYAALGIWGHPKRQSIVEGTGATQMGLMQRFLSLKNLPLGLDETGNIEPQALSYMIHQVSQGSGKIRLQQSVDAERELQLPASTLSILTGNRDYYAILTSLKDNPTGEMARLIQLNLPRPKLWEDVAVGRGHMGILMENYGWAGPEFIKHVFKVGDRKVKSLVDHWMDRFMKDFSKSIAYRFYGDILCANMSAGTVANDAKIIDFDLDRIYDVVILEMIRMRDKVVKLEAIDYPPLIAEFYLKNIDKFLILNEDRVVQEPRNELLGRIEEDKGIFILASVFKKFLATKQVSDDEFRRALETAGLLRGMKKMRLGTGWKSGTGSTPPINCFEFAPAILSELRKVDGSE